MSKDFIFWYGVQLNDKVLLPGQIIVFGCFWVENGIWVMLQGGGRQKEQGKFINMTGLLFCIQKNGKNDVIATNIKSLSGFLATWGPYQEVKGTSDTQCPSSPIFRVFAYGVARDQHHDYGVEDGQDSASALGLFRWQVVHWLEGELFLGVGVGC